MSVASNASHSVSVASTFRNLFAAVTTKRTRTGAHSDGRPVQVASTSKLERTASVKVMAAKIVERLSVSGMLRHFIAD
eukprot:gene6341-11773_t